MIIQEISKLQSFPNKHDMDLRVRTFLFHHKAELSPGALEVLKFIWRHSVKYPGVSFAKIETIEKKTGRSRSTVIRAINLFEAKGLLERKPATRPNGKRGINILVILPKEEKLPWIENEESAANHTTPPNESKREVQPATKPKQGLDSSFLPSSIPTPFISFTEPFLNVDDIFSAWKNVTHAYRKVKLNYPVEHYIEVIKRTFRQTIFAKKKGMIKKTFLGYFYGGMRESFIQEVRREVMNDPSNLYYDWLNESY